jgi:hypothetical protein
VLPADQIETLERLVDEVERVSSIGVCPFGAGREQGIGEHGGRDAGRNRREQRTLGCLAMAHRCPTPQPALERSRIQATTQRCTFPSRRLAIAVHCHAARPMEQGQINFLLREHRQEIGECSEDCQTYAPAVTVLRAE